MTIEEQMQAIVSATPSPRRRVKREDRRYFYLFAIATGEYGEKGYVSAETNKRKGNFDMALIVGADFYYARGLRNAIYGASTSAKYGPFRNVYAYGLDNGDTPEIYTSILREQGKKVSEEQARALFPDLALF